MPRNPDSASELAALDLLEASMRLPTDQREAYITSRDDLRPAVRERALELLLSDRDAIAALQTGAAGSGLYGNDEVAPDIPGYRIKRTLGRGGMGSVWLAQRDEGDFEHEVAIKVVRRGALSESLVERFRRERQILAQLNHPHIARLYDGGQTEEGQPYIVMEHVAGRTLRVWLAQDPPPDLARKLALFRQIATAVGFAHQNLIVHRDLTPGNVLVDEADRAKLIDFGIARPHREGGEQSQPSRITGLSLTPGYAAPERAHGDASNTLSDVYSLGRIFQAMLGDDPAPELAAIAARATAREPDDRYPAVSDLIDDLDRYRDGRTVPAFSTSRRYRIGKFVRRQKVLVGSVAAVLLALATGLAATTWSYQRAERARQAEATRFAQLRSLATYMLFDLNENLAGVPGNTGARINLARRAQGYLDILAASPSASSELRRETAQGLIQLARIQGVPDEPNLGEFAAAEANLARARRILAELPATPAVKIAQARAAIFAGLLAIHANSKQEVGLSEFERAAALIDTVPAGNRDTEWHLARRAQRLAMLEYADISEKRDRIPQIAKQLRADHEQWPASLRKASFDERDEAVASYYEALRLAFDDDARSLELFLANEKRFDALLERFPNDASLLYRAAWNDFDGFASASRYARDAESVRLIDKANRRVNALLAIDPLDRSVQALSSNIKEGFSQSLRDLGSFDRAIALQREVVTLRRGRLTRERTARSVGDLGFSLAILGVIARDGNERAIACPAFVESTTLLEEIERRGEILGFQQNMLGGLRKKRVACQTGASLEGPLRE